MKSLFIVILTLFTASLSFADTGVLEITSNPSGASVSINGKYVGKTPYSNPFISVGIYNIVVDAGKEFVPHKQKVKIGAIDPIVLNISFKGGGAGEFSREKIVATEPVQIGNITVASVPSGAKVLIDGKNIGVTPFAYKNIKTGRYDIEFIFDTGSGEKQKIRGYFNIQPNYDEKIVASLAQRNISSRRDRELIAEKNEKEKAFKNKWLNEMIELGEIPNKDSFTLQNLPTEVVRFNIRFLDFSTQKVGNYNGTKYQTYYAPKYLLIATNKTGESYDVGILRGIGSGVSNKEKAKTLSPENYPHLLAPAKDSIFKVREGNKKKILRTQWDNYWVEDDPAKAKSGIIFSNQYILAPRWWILGQNKPESR